MGEFIGALLLFIMIVWRLRGTRVVGSADDETKNVSSKVKRARDHPRCFDQLPTASSVNSDAFCQSYAKENKKRITRL